MNRQNAGRGPRVLGGLALALTLTAWAQSPAADAPAPLAVDLRLALHTAYDQQPSVQAARASLDAAQTQYRTLEDMGLAARLTNQDIPIRRKQAQLGVTAATGGLVQAEAEAIYAVNRTYFSVLYARAQQGVAKDVAESLAFYQKRIADGVKTGKGPREWTQSTVDKITIYRRLAENKLSEAGRGIGQASAALKEAIGLDPCALITVVDQPLPEPRTVDTCRDEVVALAFDRRGELVQASAGAQAACLEVDAQGKECMPGVVRTFAAAADIHNKVLPAGVANGEYRPGALAPEMPTHLVGSRSDRMQRARDLARRAEAVADKTRNLIALDAENAYLKYRELLQKVEQSRDAATAGKRLAENTRKDFRADQKVKIEDVLTNEVLAAQAQSAYNEALFQLLVALADLERATAGGICAGFVTPAPEALPAVKE